MKIVVVGLFYAEAFALHIATSLGEMGHDVIRYDVGLSPRFAHSPLGAFSRRLVMEARKLFSHSTRLSRRTDQRLADVATGANLVLSTHDFLSPRAVRAIHKTAGVPVAIWCPDSIASFGRAMFLNAAYDFIFLKDPYAVRVLGRESRLPVYYLPECVSASYHAPVALAAADVVRYGCDIATAGNMYPSRAAFFEALTAYDVRIWGNPPPRWMDVSAIQHMLCSEYLAGADKARAFLAAKVVLNNLHPAEIEGVNARAFEICGLGAFQIISWRSALADLFHDGSELVTYRDLSDLKCKLSRYLAAPDERRSIAAAGRVRALRDHTYEHRLQLLLDSVAGRATGYTMASSSSGPQSS